MKNSYQVKVNNTSDFEIDEKTVLNLDSFKVSDAEFHVLQQNNSYKAEITEANFNQKKYTVKVNNNTYNVNIFNELDTLIKEMGFEIGTTKKVNEIKAPMPGLIVAISIKVGQEVQEFDPLIILEAMKMENTLTSPRAGIIKSISVTNGENVNKNQLLIEFE
ncbi:MULTISPECIES: acetyl-CoA carboxylase biotin carboxyl carrier protein subunit [unclassified Polaribacter]|uniref:acetyl-CoA carboxylase biotin carboxyl carrier protein subunit n=1 Tax=unclassified Polaribacter TaxID=196858 RepID=UPI0011BFB815|nr:MULTISPECIES: acetyl-CoA carboxylase biotin carboxyl carrier protein subunit [unclassified Polaribacter]TXD53035.1 acetyl-CoA carboxylase biotin carboxyl carrier protein subunit [Polaribacter sp. IC063]TXD59464.1 acetyl-CoA carboxylase biotin carboxyl carrier protein subunit [Polaribacter sp. IC066]